MRGRERFSFVLLFCLGVLIAGQACRWEMTGAKASGKQLLSNASFEESEAGRPKAWEPRTWRGKAVFSLEGTGRSGRASAVISSDEGADASWVQVVGIEPYSRYRLSGWVKTEGLEAAEGRGALVNVHGFRDWRTGSVNGTQDWTRVEVEFDAGANDALEVTCLFGGWGRAKGKAWFDDLELIRLSGRKLGRPEAVIDLRKAGPPLSKYIYGQFIEHLGRCIYQGIWAEMLEDRKFFLPVGQGESPWKILGDQAAVTMDASRPFVGVLSPRISLRGGVETGIFQEDLAFVAGREYEGRLIIKGSVEDGAIQVRAVWGDAPDQTWTLDVQEAGRDFTTNTFRFRAAGTTEQGRLIIASQGRGWFEVGAVSLMPADNVHGFRPDVLARLKELDAPVYRWPGGNFVSGYDWRDGVGERDKRPPRKNPAWLGIEHNDVGLHEYLDLMELLGAEPYITVNSGLGDVRMARDEVEYVNGGPETPMGKLRGRHGRREPWKVRFWAIGNEMYGDWQLGHMPLADYVRKHVEFAEAMTAVDPEIKLVGCGAVGTWSETMLAEAAGRMDYISEHFYVGEKPGLLSHVSQMPAAVRRIAEAHRKYRREIPALKNKEVPVALDEWNYWYGPYVYGELGTQYFLQDALGVAAALNEYARQSDVFFMANYAQTVNVIGAVKTSKTTAVLDSTGVVLALYRKHFGGVPVAVSGSPEPLDVMACLSEAGDDLVVSAVNPTAKELSIALEIAGGKVARRADLFRVSGRDRLACNIPGRPAGVVVEESRAVPFGRRIRVPPMSASLYEVRLTE